ncbi:hypothetical protein LOD99_13512 [Oopsacas minuta]|uniref:EF-hand domain-containing protein n=1 Tax=Oopsacas minuta TaxID=111878 RepID=A0AAV7KQM9_9METZ|nr:hypothetical protein LOD99_13512 [Oopsacas minuta]
MASQLSAEQKTTILEIFSLFDHSEDHTILLKDVPVVLRSLGIHLEAEELEEVMQDLEKRVMPVKPEKDKGQIPVVTFTHFSTVVESLVKEIDNEKEIREAFQAFDKEGDGLLLAVELRQILTNMGDKMTEDEVEEMLDEVDIDANGKVDYAKLAKIITSKTVL